jgi:COP9 signalosome complex subunit 7
MTISASSNALAKLEPFLLIGKNARGAAAAKLIFEVTSSPGCYVFSELLALDGIREVSGRRCLFFGRLALSMVLIAESRCPKQLANDEQYKADYRTLELFAYGDMILYRSSLPGTFTDLTQVQLNKLRHLTLVTLASRSRVLSYSSLVASLAVKDTEGEEASAPGPSSHLSARDIRALEDIIIDAIYAGIFSARLDQRKQRVEVESIMGRDVKGTEEIEHIASVLKQW